MGHIWDGTYTIKDTGNIVSTGVIRDIPAASTPTLAKLLALITAIKNHMNGGVAEYSLFDWDSIAFASPTVTSPTGLNSTKALITFEYVNTAGNLVYDRCYLPNPDVATHFELVAGEGYRMLAASKTTLAGYLSTVTGLTITVTEGKLVTQVGKHAKTGSCVMFRDELLALCPMNISLATAGAALATFAGALDGDGFSKSTVVSSVFLTKTSARPDPASGIGLAAVESVASYPEFTTVESRAYLKLAFLVGVKKKYMSLLVPSPKSASCAQTGKGKDAWQFAIANGVTLAAAATTMFGSGNKTVTYDSSKVRIFDIKAQ